MSNHKERIEALKYYGTGDEGIELFQLTCALAYKLSGFGDTDEDTEYVVKMAEKQAAKSLEWYIIDGQDPDADDADFDEGYWGSW